MKTNSWAISPAAQALFGKNKVALKEIAQFQSWKSGTVVVCRKPNNQIHYILGSCESYSELGVFRDVHHDLNPNMNFGGSFKVINEVSFERDESGQVKYTWKDSNMELGKDGNEEFKACLAVFK